MFFVAAFVDANTGCIGAFVGTGAAAIEFAIPQNSLAGLDRALAFWAGAFDGGGHVMILRLDGVSVKANFFVGVTRPV